MLTRPKIAFAAAILLSAGSSAFAAPRHQVNHQRAAVERQVQAGAYGTYSSAATSGWGDVDSAWYAAAGEVNQSGYDFGGYVSGPRYYGGPKSSY
jgi:hypothetical protein